MPALFIQPSLKRFASALLVAFLAHTSLAAEAHPRIAGFERFYLAGNADAVASGQLLLGELNCTSCHQADAALAGYIERKRAPVLDTVGSRVKPQYLLKFLADPQATKPGTTMPSVLAGVPESERAPIVEAIVHFLASTGSVTHANPMRQHVNRGEMLFHSIGCVACHDPRKEPMQPSLPTSIVLGTPSRKYTLPGLTQFLENPLAIRPSGRMPHLGLSPADARDIASFLLNDLDIASGLQYAYYEGQWDKLPDFSKLTPVATGDAPDFDVSVAKRKEQFGLRFDGSINIPKDGDYLFLIGSDDGSRLSIDGKEVVKVDGIHPFQQARKKLKMTAGVHTVTVEYFEQGGEEILQVDFEGPGMPQMPLSALIAAPVTKGAASPPEEFQVDASLAAKGREHFQLLGCASCHDLKVEGHLLETKKPSPALSSLKETGGCLSESPGKSPYYALNARQRETLAAAIRAAKEPPREPLPAKEYVSLSLVRFNCLACHERDKLGGVEATRNSHFQSDMPEMGDEGRLPPQLRGVGAKLTSQWLKTVLEQGPKDRPYMFTRMPQFGIENVAGLATALEKTDVSAVPAESQVPPADSEKKIKAAGRRLVGAQGFSCIKCHTFADKRSTGIQAMSLTTMTRRLRPEWFHDYLLDPQRYRPGTRMPTPFANGQTTLPSVLDGSVAKQTDAIWSYLADGDQAILPIGLVTGKIELIAFDEAVIYRNFLEGVGTRGIGVGYPAKLNLAFDANDMRLAMIWHGAFIDASRHWEGRGAGFEKPLGDNVINFPTGPPFAVLETAEKPWPKESAKELGYQFRGYRLAEKRQPIFLYRFGDVQIEDYPAPVGDEDVFVFKRKIELSSSSAPTNLKFRAATGSIENDGGGVYLVNQRLKLSVTGPALPELRKSGDSMEMIVPVVFEGGKASIEVTYDW